MARTITLAELRNGTRRRGGWINSRRVTTEFLNDALNSAISEVWDLLIEKWADYYSSEATPTTTPNVDFVALPATFYKLRKVEMKWSSALDDFVRLRPHDLESSHVFRRQSGRTFRYRIQGAQLRLVPTPTVVETLRITFIPWATVLTADGDTFDGINGYEELVMQIARRAVCGEMDLDTTDAETQIAKLTARIRTASDGRDAAEAFYLDPMGPRDDEWDDEDVWR